MNNTTAIGAPEDPMPAPACELCADELATVLADGENRCADCHSRIIERADAEPNTELLAIVRRIKRKAEIMKLDARAIGQGSTRQDAEEIRILAEMAERRLGGEHA